MNYTNKTDEEILLEIENGNQDATEYLLKKYAPLVKRSTRTLYLIGADSEDLSQEGMIGLFKAIQNYKENTNASFYTFAKLCIERQIYSAIKASNRKKHSPLNSYVSFYSQNNEEDTNLLENLTAGNASNPETIVLDQEALIRMQKLLRDNLSKMENEILPLYMEGLSYHDIAMQIDKPVKSIDNAVQRIRDKVKKLYQKEIE